MTDLPAGESCTYKVIAPCGFPALDISTTSVGVSVINSAGGDLLTVEEPKDEAILTTEAAEP